MERIKPNGGMNTNVCPMFQGIAQPDTRYWKNVVYYPIPVSDIIDNPVWSVSELYDYMDMHGMPRREGQFVYRFWDGCSTPQRAFIVAHDEKK